MTNNKVSFKNVLIFVFGILSIFITAFFAPIVQNKVHQKIVVNAQNDKLENVSCMFNSLFFDTVSYSVSGSFNYKSSDTYTQSFYTLSYNADNSGTIKYGNNVVYENGAWIKDSYRYFNIVTLNNDNTYTILNYDNGYLDVYINSGRYSWVDAPVMPDVSLETNLTFSSDGRSCTGILFDDIGMSYEFTDTGYDKVYTYENWSNSSYKFLSIVTSYIDCQFYLYEFYSGNLSSYTPPTPISYTITDNLTNVSSAPSNVYQIDENGTRSLTYSWSIDYSVKNSDVVVSNATYTLDFSTSNSLTIHLSNPTNNVTISITATLDTFSISYGQYKYDSLTIPNTKVSRSLFDTYFNQSNSIIIDIDFYVTANHNRYNFAQMKFDYSIIDTSYAYLKISYLGNSSFDVLSKDNTSSNGWLSDSFKYPFVTLRKVVSNTQYRLFNQCFDTTTLKTIASGAYTFIDNPNAYSNYFTIDMPFQYWNGQRYNDTLQSKLVVNYGIYYYSSNGNETIVYSTDIYINNNARAIYINSNVSVDELIYDSFMSMVTSGNSIGYNVNGSYTFTFTSLSGSNDDFTSFAFDYFLDNYYSKPIHMKGFKIVNGYLYYIDFNNNDTLVYNGAWVNDYYRYISISDINLSTSQYNFLTSNGVFQNLYHGESVTTWQQFFFTIADVPLYIFSRIFYFELFGEQTFIIIYSIITILIVFKIVSWALKLKD